MRRESEHGERFTRRKTQLTKETRSSDCEPFLLESAWDEKTTLGRDPLHRALSPTMVGNSPKEMARSRTHSRSLPSRADPSLPGLARLRWCSSAAPDWKEAVLAPPHGAARPPSSPRKNSFSKPDPRDVYLSYRALYWCASIPAFKKKNQKR